MPRLRRLAGNLAAAALSLAFCGAALEVVARLVVRSREARPHTTRGSFVRFHPLLGWDKPPGASGWLHRPEYSVHLEVNAKGLRGPDRPYEKPPGVHRTLLVGDSFTEGYTVAEEKTTRAVLEAELRRSGVAAEVINGGTLGYSTDQELLFYRMEGHKYQPDLVVVLFCSNDLYFNTTGEQGKPWFELEDGRLLLQGSPVRAKKGQWQRGPEPRVTSVASLHGSMALRLLAERASSHPRLQGALTFFRIVDRPRTEPIPMEMTPLGTLHPEVRAMWAVTDALLAGFKAEVEAAGGRLAVLYIPDRYHLSPHVWELTRERYGMGKRFSPDRIYTRLKRACEELAIPFVDPFAALRAAEESGRSGYFPEDGHWNELGHAIAARAIAPVVLGAGPRAASTSASLAP